MEYVKRETKSVTNYARRLGKFYFFFGRNYVKNSRNHISDRGFISRIYKELSELNSKYKLS